MLVFVLVGFVTSIVIKVYGPGNMWMEYTEISSFVSQFMIYETLNYL